VGGWIKDYRQELDSDIWMMPPLYHRVWQWIKYKVNHEDGYVPLRDGGRQEVLKGQHMTSIRQIAQGVGWYEGRKWKEPNPKTIRAILKWLEQQGMITITTFRGNNGYTLLTVVNWEIYQSKNDEGNNEHPFEKQRTDINKNDKNDKNLNDDNNPADERLPDPFEEQLTDEQRLEKEVEDYYQTKRGRYGFPATQKDREFIKKAIEEKFTQDEIIQGINLAFLQAESINSFEYCLKVMRTERDKRLRQQRKKVVPMQQRRPVQQEQLPESLRPESEQQLTPEELEALEAAKKRAEALRERLKQHKKVADYQ
jgi:hypothetical protein